MNFDVKRHTESVVEWIRNWFEENGKGCNAVVGISGGKDSSVVAGLCCRALGKERVIGVMMPNGEQFDIGCSQKLCDSLGIRNYTINIKESFDAVVKQMQLVGLDPSDQTMTNLAPRIRMATLYAVSQSLNGRVANTCNLSEDWVGYSTRYGDSVGDFSPLSKFTVQEVKAIGHELGLPYDLVEKTPIDGLVGKTDEDNLGFTYAELDRYIRTGEIENLEHKALIDRKHKANLFKLKFMPIYDSGIEEKGF